MQAKLVVVGGSAGAPQYELQLPAIIGRSRKTDVTVEHPLVSRHHCEVYESAGQLMLRDLGSLNGTFLGQTRLAESPLPVQSGDQFSIGPVTFRAEYRPPDRAPRDDIPRDGAPGNPQRPPGEPDVDSTLRRVVWKRL